MEKEKTVNFGKENDSPSTKRSSLYVDDEKMIEKEKELKAMFNKINIDKKMRKRKEGKKLKMNADLEF